MPLLASDPSASSAARFLVIVKGLGVAFPGRDGGFVSEVCAGRFVA